ncbi:glycogen debranching protein GlgX [Luteimicrobium subarcticum]|uniref:Glycogen operon protein n=1 Tax=Luteimicrobium subarcticum TaxID=620910 RepID=A0A2M8W1F7_9MICO|nr:glycogen debranching protein GlgX [Luteimicrobium subarcticum]PJI84745.1 glycogen operon protein [Luteimicrobium subarcticum]
MHPGQQHVATPPLGVHVTPDGITVAVAAPRADAVDLCLLDDDGTGGLTERRVELRGPSFGVWWARVPGVRPGQRYGFRVHGSWNPARGLLHNPAKLLVDPYARGLAGTFDHAPQAYGYVAQGVPGSVSGDAAGAADPRDSAPHVPHSVVVDVAAVRERTPDPAANRPAVAWSDTVLYEAHVRGLTMLHPGVPDELRGTYRGLAHPAVVEHLVRLGVTTVELLPVHAAVDEPHLVAKGLTNYWGYNTLGYFVPDARLATAAARDAGPGAVLAEVREAVHALHEAGIEVVLDVVYNHTCEAGADGPTLSWRGLDNVGYYLHDGGSPARLFDTTGCGNTLDFRRPRVVQLALDSLRYWADVVGVDGFRFDLAVTLGRSWDGFDPHHPFLVTLQADPSLANLKMIAEPWDLGPGGWQTGGFPAPFAEWNDRFRGAVRQFWLSDVAGLQAGHLPHEGVGDMATRLAGSADLFGHSDPPLLRGPVASINFVTAHDGFTLRDLVTYDDKHNEANGEHGRDGTSDNRSWNHGLEGDGLVGLADTVRREQLRRRSMRNLLATTVLAAGTPMITAGDEFGRSQGGNNNAYCQDNPVSWVSWDLAPWQRDLLEHTRTLLALRRDNPALRVDAFYRGRPLPGDEPTQPDLSWFDAAGEPLTRDDWQDPSLRTLQMLRRTPVEGSEHVLVAFNGTLHPVELRLAGEGNTDRSFRRVWTSLGDAMPASQRVEREPGDFVVLDALSFVVYLAAPRG